MKISHLKEAVAVTALIGLVWAGPQLFATAVPDPSIAKTSSEPVVLGQETETAEFTVPAGWDIEPRKSDSAISLSDGDTAIDIRINDGGFNDANSLERTLLNLNREGTAAAWDGEEFSAPGLVHKGTENLDLTARKCSVIQPATIDDPSLVGNCVIAAGHGFSISIVAVHADSAADATEGKPDEPGQSGQTDTHGESVEHGQSSSAIDPVAILKSAVIKRDGDSDIVDSNTNPRTGNEEGK